MSETVIHPTAQVDRAADLGQGVCIGAFAVIDGPVQLGDGVRVGPHAVIAGRTTIGRGCTISPHAVIGTEPQDLKYRGEPTEVHIGAETQVREFATVNRGTAEGGGLTRVGTRCLVMATAHVAHDCHLHDGVILANGAALAGHVVIEEQAILGGLVGVHQFVRIGAHAFVGGCSALSQDVPPFVTVVGNRAVPHGLNVVGLRRRGFSREALRVLKRAYDLLYRSGLNTRQALEAIETQLPDLPEVRRFVAFIRASRRGICK